MEFQIDAEENLDKQEEHKDSGKGRVDVMCKLATAVGVAEEVS